MQAEQLEAEQEAEPPLEQRQEQHPCLARTAIPAALEAMTDQDSILAAASIPRVAAATLAEPETSSP